MNKSMISEFRSLGQFNTEMKTVNSLEKSH